jgi:alanine dehydrogenase
MDIKFLVQKNAGQGSGYKDSDYVDVGAVICDTIEDSVFIF